MLRPEQRTLSFLKSRKTSAYRTYVPLSCCKAVYFLTRSAAKLIRAGICWVSPRENVNKNGNFDLLLYVALTRLVVRAQKR
jgi:hypothetical protein